MIRSEGEGKLLLLVEDEPIVALDERSRLEASGYAVVTARSGREAIQSVTDTSDIDLVLMDIDLGDGMDGTEAARRILTVREVPIVFLSSHTEPEVVERTEAITSYGYVVKHSGDTVLKASLRMAFRLYDANQLQRENERLAEASEKRFRTMVESAPDPIIIQVDGSFAYANPAALRLFGADSPRQLIGTRVVDRCGGSSERRREFLERMDRVSNRREATTDLFEQEMVRLDGARVWVETLSEPIEYLGERAGLVFVHDLTSRREGDLALRESEKRFAMLADNAPGLLYLCSYDEDFTPIYLNDQIEELSGYPAHDFRLGSRTFGELVYFEDVERIGDSVTRAVENNEPYHHVFRIVRSNGDLLEVEEHGAAIRDDEGTVLYLGGFLFDVSKRMDAERRLMRALHEKDVLMRELHHRVKNNLNVVASLLSLQAGRSDSAREAENLLEARSRVTAMMQIYSLLQGSGDFDSVDIAVYLSELSSSLVSTYGLSGTQVHMKTVVNGQVVRDLLAKDRSGSAASSPSGLSLDTGRAVNIGLIVNELVSNCLKYAFSESNRETADEHAEVTLSVEDMPDALRIQVCDNGVGLPDNFDPASDGSTGMQVVLALAEQLGGNIVFSGDGGTAAELVVPT